MFLSNLDGKQEGDILIALYFQNSIAGSFNGALSTLPAHNLGTVCIKEVLSRSNIPADQISEVILGQVLYAGV